ncbi:MAG: hypothetical protein ABJA02_05580 [Acidobacteriota bacterium]
MKEIFRRISFRLGFLLMTAWFAVLNILDYLGSDRPYLPDVPHFFGVPFSIYRWGYPIGIMGFDWVNFIVDLIIIFVFAFITGMIFVSVSLIYYRGIARRSQS